MIIFDSQKQQLKELLTKEEYDLLETFEVDIGKYQSELDDLIISRFDDNDEDTPESEKLQKLYDEIYNQN